MDWEKLEGDMKVAREEMSRKMAARQDSPRARAFLKQVEFTEHCSYVHHVLPTLPWLCLELT